MRKLLAVLPLFALLAACQAKFDDANLAKLKDEIGRQAASKGYRVVAIDVAARGDLKARGTAVLVNPRFPGQTVTWNCTADMGKDATFAYKCVPQEADMLKEKIRETIAAQKLTVEAIDLARAPNGDYAGSAVVGDPAHPGRSRRWSCQARLKPGTSGDSANFKWSCTP